MRVVLLYAFTVVVDSIAVTSRYRDTQSLAELGREMGHTRVVVFSLDAD